MLATIERPYSARSIASLGQEQRQAWLKTLSSEQVKFLRYDWHFWAREKQLPPEGDWRIWLLLAGRGFGKSRAICEFARTQANDMPGSRGAVVARSAADVRDVLVEGESGLLHVCPPWNRPKYEPSKRRLTWINGTTATLFSADKPEQLRGPQFHWAIADELAHWRYPSAWDMLMLGLRLGDNPRCAVATTPRPVKIIKELVESEDVAVTRGTTYENRANLADAFFAQIITRYEGTHLGRQEIRGEILEDREGALWQRQEMIEQYRVTSHPDLTRIVVGVDPPGGATECGIVVAGVSKVDGKLHAYVIDDKSLKASPGDWGKEVVTAYWHNQADRVVGEVNFGGDMVEHTIRTVDDDVSYKDVRASRGKQVRAEPVAALYEQGRVHHVGQFAELEDEMTSWVPGETTASPNRVDALVWCLSELIVKREDKRRASWGW